MDLPDTRNIKYWLNYVSEWVNILSTQLIILTCTIFFVVGCASQSPSSSLVSKSKMANIESEIREIKIGMPKQDFLSKFSNIGGDLELLGTTTLENGKLEEWHLTAYTRDESLHFWYGWERKKDILERYFYFVNSKLADMSANQLAYRDRQALIIEWRDR